MEHLLRKLNLVPYPVQLTEINAKRKVQQQEQKLHTDIVPIRALQSMCLPLGSH